MGCLRLQVDSIYFGHTLAFRNLLWSVHHVHPWFPKQYFVPYLVMMWPWLLIFRSQISKMLNTIPTSLYFLLGTLEWSYRSKTVSIPMFGYVINLAFDLWTLIFSEMLYTAPTSLFHWQKSLPGTLRWSYGSITGFLVVWWPWPLDLKFSEMLFTTQINVFNRQKLLPCTFEWSYGSKPVILSIFGEEVTLIFWHKIFKNA